jgi:hypothetical protein
MPKEIELDLTEDGREMSGFEKGDSIPIIVRKRMGGRLVCERTAVVEVWNECSKRNWIGISGQIVSGWWIQWVV